MSRQKSFLSGLFDFSFSTFIAPRIVGLLYILGILFSGLMALSVLFAGLASRSAFSVLALVATPLVFLLYVIIIRVSLEGLIIGFRTAENTGRTAENTEYLKRP